MASLNQSHELLPVQDLANLFPKKPVKDEGDGLRHWIEKYPEEEEQGHQGCSNPSGCGVFDALWVSGGGFEFHEAQIAPTLPDPTCNLRVHPPN